MRSTGRFRAYPEGREPTGEGWQEPPVTQGMPSAEQPSSDEGRRVDGARLMAHLASQPMKNDEEVTDPRHAIVRPDTVDDSVRRRVERRRPAAAPALPPRERPESTMANRPAPGPAHRGRVVGPHRGARVP